MDFSKLKLNQYKFFFTLPAFIFILIFWFGPNILSFYLAFTDWSTYHRDINFTGFQNVLRLVGEGELWKSGVRTLIYAILVSVLINICALAIALVLEKTNRISGTLRTLYFVPVLISPLAAGYIFKAIFYPTGPINNFLSFITGQSVEIPFLGGIYSAFIATIIVVIWKSMGIPILIFIAGLNLIPQDFIEAAKVEGASNWNLITKIKVPLLGPAFTFTITTSVIGSLSTFDVIYALTQGGPGRATEMINFFIWRVYGTGRLSHATMGSLLLLILVIFIAFPLVLYLRKREVEL